MDVTIYEDVNFSGRSETLEIGGHRLFSAADLNDEVSSIKVPAGLVALVYEHADEVGGYGRSADLMEDHADLATLGLGDTISYVQVFAAQSSVVALNHATGQTETVPVVWARGSVVNGQYVPGHWEAPRAQPPPPGPAVVSPGPLPHLLHISKIQGDDWVNPVHDTSSVTWSSQVVGGSTYDGSDAHPFEWVSVLNPTMEQDDEVGVAGFAVGVDLSGADLPFTHPFGGDFEFGIAPDAEYAGLLAPSNRDPNSDNDNIKNAFPDGRRIGLPVNGALPMEVEAGMVPSAYRAQVGDRVAAYGRWIVDAGHKDLHSEIHPPLLLARAQAVNSQDADAYPDASAVTLLQLWSRPYQAAQKFTDGGSKNLSLVSYLTNISETLGDIKAYPPTFPKPFDGIHLVSFLVRPPVPTPPPGPRALGPAQLECSYSFTTNKACGVQVQQSLSDPNAVEVILALNSVGYPSLPQPPSTMVKYKIDDLVRQIPADLGTLTKFLVDAVEAYQSKFGLSEADLYVRQYNPLPAPDVSTHAVPFTLLNNLPRSSVNVDDTQPFPIIGWLKVKWAHPSSIVAGGNVGTVMTFDPGLLHAAGQPGQSTGGTPGGQPMQLVQRVPLRRPTAPT
jgi:hypothetical protein